MNEYNMGGLIPDTSSDLRRRIEKLEARLAELEKGKAEPEPDWRKLVARLAELEKGKPEPKQWEPKIKLTLTSPPTLPNAEFIKIGDKAFQYIRQLQWLYEHYPEQNGEWSEKTEYSIRYDMDNKEYVASSFRYLLPVTLVYMSLEAARHLRDDMNSGKVRF